MLVAHALAAAGDSGASRLPWMGISIAFRFGLFHRSWPQCSGFPGKKAAGDLLHCRPKEARSGRALDQAFGDERFIMMFGFAALSERSFASTTLEAQTQVGYGT